MAGNLSGECLHALSGIEAVAWGIAGSFVSWVVLMARPWAARATKEIREGKLHLTFDPQLLAPGAVMMLYLAALGLVGALIGDPSTSRDGFVWGLGAESIAAALTGKRAGPDT